MSAVMPMKFGQPTGHLVAHNGYTGGFEGDYWSYESLKDGVGLVFTIRDNKVTHIAALDSAYSYRPTAKE